MDFIEDYPKLEAAQRDHFQHVVTRLLSGAVLSPGSPLKVDPDWRFAERYRDLIDSYLRVGGDSAYIPIAPLSCSPLHIPTLEQRLERILGEMTGPSPFANQRSHVQPKCSAETFLCVYKRAGLLKLS